MAVRRVITTTRILKAVVRTALPEDLPEVTRLLSTLGPDASEQSIARFLRWGGQVVVATVLGEVAGVAALEWLHPLQSAHPEAWLTSLVTGAQFRHRGVARALLEECSRRARSAGGDRLSVAAAAERDEVRAFLCAARFEPRLIVYQRMV